MEEYKSYHNILIIS